MPLNFNDPEVQRNMYLAIEQVCIQSGLPIAGSFMKQQAKKAQLKMDVQEQDSLLRQLELRSTSDVPRLEHKVA